MSKDNFNKKSEKTEKTEKEWSDERKNIYVSDTCFDIKNTIEKLEYHQENIKHEIEKLKEFYEQASEKKSSKKNVVLETFIKTCHDIKNRLEKLEIKSIDNELFEFSKDVKHEIEKLKDLYFPVSSESESESEKTEPSGFTKPIEISNNLCNFLNIPNGSKRARTEVTKYIINYIRDNNLQSEHDRRTIKPDVKLAQLLNYKGGETLTYYNLQKWMKPHYER